MLTDSISTRYISINEFIIETMVLVVMCTTISTRIKAKVQKKKQEALSTVESFRTLLMLVIHSRMKSGLLHCWCKSCKFHELFNAFLATFYFDEHQELKQKKGFNLNGKREENYTRLYCICQEDFPTDCLLNFTYYILFY